MTPNVSKELKTATENLHTTQTAMQQAESEMMNLRSKFINTQDPVKKEKLKPLLIAASKKLKEAEAAAVRAEAMFQKVLSYEPDDVYDLLDHKIQETIIRLAIRKIVKETINSSNNLLESKSIKLKSLIEADQPDSLVSLAAAVQNFFNSNKKKFEKLIDEEEWDDFYDMAFDKFPDADQDDVAQALNKAASMSGFFENEDVSEMPTEKELETMAFGEKSQQKGIKMGDYDKKNKLPKASPTELKPEELKKLKTESKKKDFELLEEAEYRGRKVTLNKPFYTPGGPRKRAVYVKNDKGNVVKVGFGDPNMRIKKNIPGRRKSFRARHKCDTPGPRHKARYWSCKFW